MFADRLATTPADVEDRSIRAMIERQVKEGQLPLDLLTDQAHRAKQWTMEAYADVLRSLSRAGPSVTGVARRGPFADAEQAWREDAKDRLRRMEGHREEVYPDANKGWAAPTVGYGFNLEHRALGRAAAKKALGLDDKGVDAFATGARRMTREESEKVLDVAIDMVNNQIDRELRGTPIPGPARAALVDLVYNAGIGAVKSRGIFEAIRNGDKAAAITAILGWKDPQKHVNQRRRIIAADLVSGDFDRFRHLFE